MVLGNFHVHLGCILMQYRFAEDGILERKTQKVKVHYFVFDIIFTMDEKNMKLVSNYNEPRKLKSNLLF